MASTRELLGRALPKGIPFSESLNNNALFVSMRRERFSACPELPSRFGLHGHVARQLDGPIDYLEFGVWQGSSIKHWSTLKPEPESRFYGFDSFEGLPEDWIAGNPKGTFSTQGQPPRIDDSRVAFLKGWFQQTLYPFLKDREFNRQLVVHVDCDLYSSTLFVLSAMDRHMKPGTVIIFDDFYSLDHEFKAFADYDRSFGREWRAIGRTAHCGKVAIELMR